MPVIVEITNPAKLKKAKDLLGAKTDNETLELALERVIEEFEPKEPSSSEENLPESFFEDLYADESALTDGESVRAITSKREESDF